MNIIETAAPNDRKLVNKKTIAERYGISERTVQDWMVQGFMPFYKLGYIVRFDPTECDEAIERFRKNSSDQE
jgi:excisionase family DNA binding protein